MLRKKVNTSQKSPFFFIYSIDFTYISDKMVFSGKWWELVGVSGMEMLTGEYRNKMDEKGRIPFPSRMRAELTEGSLMVTQSPDGCLWLFTMPEWKEFSSKLMESASPFNPNSRLVLRRLIAPAQPVEFDKTGRISIPQSLRDYASLTKDCVILGINKYIELWDAQKYEAYLEQTDLSFREATEELGNICF